MIEHGPIVRHEPNEHGTFVRGLEVVNATPLSRGFRRITLGGEDLNGFSSLGPADHVKFIFGEGESALRRDYTPRNFRPASDGAGAELDVDFYLHGEGIASTWSLEAVPGSPVSVGGPRGSRVPPTGAKRVVLGADESSLPALARWIEMLDEDVEILAYVELSGESDAAYLEPSHVHRARVVWLDKADNALERAIHALGPIDTETFLWLAGEATTLVPIRRYLRRELELPAHQVKIDGYWKRGEAGRDHHAPIDPSDPDD